MKTTIEVPDELLTVAETEATQRGIPVADYLSQIVTSRLTLNRQLEEMPAEVGPSMVKKQGLWVYTGKVPSGFDVVQAIRDDREDRVRELSGL